MFDKTLLYQNICPGLVSTEMATRWLLKDADKPIMTSKDVADTVIFVLSTPHHVQVCITIENNM